MKIGIDIDGVINNEAAFLIDYGTKFSYENFLNYYIDVSKNGTHNIFDWPHEIDNTFWEKYYVIYLTSDKYIRQFSQEIISKLHENNEIHIITARDSHNTKISQNFVELLTKSWLEKNQFPYDKIVFTSNKRQYIKDNSIDIMIEDNPYSILELSNDIPILCYHTAYNSFAEGENIFRVNSWYEILSKIIKLKNEPR